MNNDNRGYSISIASDHAGLILKNLLSSKLAERGHNVKDFGTFATASVDYPDYAKLVCTDVLLGKAERGVLICGSGIGMSIAANRYSGIRCALIHNDTLAVLSRQHNNTNVIAFGARFIQAESAWECLLTWLQTPFDGGRHQQRIDKIEILNC